MTGNAQLVHSRITHTRLSPVRHAFTYRSVSWLVDIDSLPTLSAPLRPFAQFRGADHFPEPMVDGQTLRDRLNAHLLSVGKRPPDGKVVALTSPRVAGYVFNPLSVYWCYRADGSLAYAVAEVHNTYGGRHCYVVELDDHGRAEVDKEFYVSPFNDVSGNYRLRMPPPTDGRVAVSIVLERDGHEPFVASLSGRIEPATSRAIVATQMRAPLAPLVVSARIRFQGIKLWAKRLPIAPRPPQDSAPPAEPTEPLVEPTPLVEPQPSLVEPTEPLVEPVETTPPVEPPPPAERQPPPAERQPPPAEPPPLVELVETTPTRKVTDE
ncbi:hypothetical protein ABW18_17670 [Gordonia jacobaea]|uniref:DUF1365 domain-containing protein n=2 Tax=Gordonia TaxID=2053 RepID=A0ABR5I978_9ACTN|nr:hypothetical protein ABW18_17670 [Gordonia jacobaea]